MVYDAQLDQIVLFGGKDYRHEMQQKTLSFENGELKLLASEGPSPRHSFGFTYNIADQAAYLYGGKEYRGEEQIALKDFWKWDGSVWIELKSSSD